jgi:hypothetical protein
MNQLTAVPGLLPLPLQQVPRYRINSPEHLATYLSEAGPAGQVKKILKRSKLTVTKLSAISRSCREQDPHYFIPPSFLFKLSRGISPHVGQIVALSEITGHSFADCMQACGFDLDLIFRLQLRVHAERTVLVTPNRSTRDGSVLLPDSSFNTSAGRCLFAKIGKCDAAFYPELQAGSLVRIDRGYFPCPLCAEMPYQKRQLWLVEHSHGLTCSEIKRVDDKHIVLLPARPPLSAWPLRLGAEVQILGLVDPGTYSREGSVSGCLYTAGSSFSPRRCTSLSRLLRLSRTRTGLTLRAAHETTLEIAKLMGNRQYRVALGMLSDYEAMDTVPRHVAKIVSLCIVYCIDFWDLLEASGIGRFRASPTMCAIGS